jgi:glutathione S-transferase
MRTLYHFPTSPFSRRARLALMHKGLEVTLKDARADDALRAEAQGLWALKTVPVLVEDDGHAIGDSTAIVHYLDEAYPGPRLFPTEKSARLTALTIAQLVDGMLNTLVDVGTRYYPLRESSGWRGVQDTMLGRVSSALGALGERAAANGPKPFTQAGWCAPDIFLFTAVAWLESLPGRAATNANVAQIVSLPWSLPASLPRWADAFRARSDVMALGV